MAGAIAAEAPAQAAGGGEVVPLRRPPLGDRTTGANVPVAQPPGAPRGFALASVRSLRTLTGPATDLRPATRAASLPTNPGGHIPSLPAAVRRQAADAAPAATVVRRSVRTPEPAKPTGTGAASVPAAPSSSSAAATATTRPAAHAPATSGVAPTTGDIASAGRAATAAPAATASAPTIARTSAVTPGQRLAAISMTDQFVVRRRAVHGSRDVALGSGFGAVEVIRPSTVSRSAPLAPGASGLQPIRPRVATAAPAPPSTITAGAAAAPSGPAAPPARPAPTATAAARPGVATTGAPISSPTAATALRRSSAQGAPALGGALPGAAGPPPVPAVARADLAGTAFAGTAFAASGPAGAVLRRSFVVAPPPISLGPRRSTPAAAAATSAAPAAAPKTAPAPGGRSSIYTAAAELFRAFGRTSAAQRGGDMSDSSNDGAQVVRRSPSGQLATRRPQTIEEARAALRPVGGRAVDASDASRPTVAPAGTTLDPRQLDDLVDQVVDRIEQRVIDELERRGRFGIVGGM